MPWEVMPYYTKVYQSGYLNVKITVHLRHSECGEHVFHVLKGANALKLMQEIADDYNGKNKKPEISKRNCRADSGKQLKDKGTMSLF